MVGIAITISAGFSLPNSYRPSVSFNFSGRLTSLSRCAQLPSPATHQRSLLPAVEEPGSCGLSKHNKRTCWDQDECALGDKSSQACTSVSCSGNSAIRQSIGRQLKHRSLRIAQKVTCPDGQRLLAEGRALRREGAEWGRADQALAGACAAFQAASALHPDQASVLVRSSVPLPEETSPFCLLGRLRLNPIRMNACASMPVPPSLLQRSWDRESELPVPYGFPACSAAVGDAFGDSQRAA